MPISGYSIVGLFPDMPCIKKDSRTEDDPEGFQGGGFKPNLKPFGFGGGALKPETRKVSGLV